MSMPRARADREQGPSVSLPIVLMSGYSDQRERTSGMEALIRDVIAKPFTLAELRFSVASALAQGKK